MATVPTTEPTRIRAGDTLKFTKSLADYPASEGWVLTYSFRQPSDSAKNFQFTATASGSDYAITVAATDTANWTAGDYIGQATVALNDEKYTVWEGSVTVTVSLATADGPDLRSHAQKMVDILQASMEASAPKEVQDYEIDGVKISRIPLLERKQLLNQYRQELKAEQIKAGIANGRGNKRNIFFRFTPMR